MLANGVKETTATTGTGPVTLSAVTGFVRFSQAFAAGDLVSYAILDGGNREWGLGTIGAGNTLARTYIKGVLMDGVYLRDGAVAIPLSGAATVMCASAAEVASVPPLRVEDALMTAICVPFNYLDTFDFGLAAMAAGTAYYHAVWLPDARPLSALGAIVSTAAAGSSIAIGLFASGPSGLPDRTLASVEVSGETTGNSLASVSPALELPPGWYWAGVVSDGSPTVRGPTNIMPSAAGIYSTRFMRHFRSTNPYAPFGATAFANKSVASPSLSPNNNTAAPGVIYK